MSRTGKDPNGQDDVDAIFGEIVADLRAEGVGTRINPDRGGRLPATEQDEPADEREENRQRDEKRQDDRGASDARDDLPGQRPAASDWRTSDVSWDDTMLSDGDSIADDDEHFVPPEPPPLPKPTRSMGIVALFIVVGLVLLIAPHLIGIGVTVGTPLGMLSLAAGLGFLLLRARDDPRPPPGADPDNGAQV